MIAEFTQISKRYLKANKKRTILTIVGIMLSVALISTIGLFFKSIQETEIESVRSSQGSYHIIYSKVDENLYTKVSNNPKIGRFGLYTQGEEFKINEKVVLFEVNATDKALELLPCKPAQGKLPEKENEVAIEKWAIKFIDENAKIGDKIKIKEKEYILVGVLENSIENQMNNKSMLLFRNNEVQKDKAILLAEVSQKTNLKKAIKELKALEKEENIKLNTSLIVAQGAGDDKSAAMGLYSTVAIVVGIVVISTIAVIYNSFQISVVERVKQFGLLRAVGATPKQIRKLVFREATVLSLISIPIGLLCGIIAISAIGLVFKLIGADTVLNMKTSISWGILGLSAIVGVVSVYISALIPARFAGKISPLVAISSRATITKEKIKRRKRGIIGKIFGFEGDLAAKNIKRNRKRYRITVFSIVISVVLFVTFKSFMDMSLQISDDLNESKNIHFSIYRDSQGYENKIAVEDSIVEKIKAIDSVEKVYKKYDITQVYCGMEKSSEIKEVQDIQRIYKDVDVKGVKTTGINGAVSIYDDDSLEVTKKYLEAGSINKEALNKENGVILVNKNRTFNEVTRKKYYGPIANLKVGDEILLKYVNIEELNGENPTDNKEYDYTDLNKGNVKKVKIMAIVNTDPFNFWGYEDGLKLITSEEVGKTLLNTNELKTSGLSIVIKDPKMETSAKNKIEEAIKGNPNLDIINNIDQNRQQKSIMLMIQILLYGFVVVVSLIGSVNIINTITTNIILRKREFSTLMSIGLTQKGLKKMIVLEGLLYGVVGTIYGSIIGSGLSFLMFSGLSEVREFGWQIPWVAITISGVAALTIGYLSVLAPLRRIKKENIIEAIREDY